jgi:putative SOS response-associated peptidase YedK
MAVAGLLDGFKWPDGTVRRTFTIVTAHANAIMAELQGRTPVTLEPQDWSPWLERVEGEPATLLR